MTDLEELQIATALAQANLHFLRRMGLLDQFLTTTQWAAYGISEELARMWWTRYEWSRSDTKPTLRLLDTYTGKAPPSGRYRSK